MVEEELAGIGEIVIYTGDLSHAFDQSTEDLMNKYLVQFERYTIISVGNYDDINKYYRFKEFDFDYSFYYPCKSFIKNYKIFYKLKYNLK